MFKHETHTAELFSKFTTTAYRVLAEFLHGALDAETFCEARQNVGVRDHHSNQARLQNEQ